MTTASSGSNAAAATNSNSDNDSSGRGGGDGFTEQDLVKGLSVGQQQLLKRFRNGNVVYAHISRDALILWFQCTQCQYDVVTGLLDVAMSHFVELYAKEVFDIMQNPALCTRPDTKKVIKDVLTFAAKEVPPLIEHFSKTWPVQDFPKLPAEITSKLRVGAFYHSSLGGVFVRYVLCGKSVSAHHHQVVDKTTMPVVNDEGSKDTCIVKPSVGGAPSSTTEKQAMPMPKIHAASASPSPTAKSLTRKAYLIADEEVASDEASGGSSNDGDECWSPQKPPPSLSPSADEGSATPPPTPPLSPSLGSSSSTDDSPPPSVESPPLLVDSPPPPPLAQLPPPSLASSMQDSRPVPKTFSVNPLGGMFSPPLDKPRVVMVIQDVLCSKRVINYRDKASKVMTEVKSGRVSAETMEWIIRGLRSMRAKNDLKQRHGGLVFVGPQWGAPLYKTGNGVGRLLRGVAKKHGAGKKFVVCVSSGSSGDNATSDTKMITGIISNAPNASPSASNSTGHVEPVMDGDAPSLQDWSNVRGNLDDGSRLWAWVY